LRTRNSCAGNSPPAPRFRHGLGAALGIDHLLGF
jgi:hypothetical protein